MAIMIGQPPAYVDGNHVPLAPRQCVGRRIRHLNLDPEQCLVDWEGEIVGVTDDWAFEAIRDGATQSERVDPCEVWIWPDGPTRAQAETIGRLVKQIVVESLDIDSAGRVFSEAFPEHNWHALIST